MEINFGSMTVKAFRENFRQIKRIPLSMESVVPDVNDDIGRIYSVHPCVLLKSKDASGRGASVTGEVTVTLLYVNEQGSAVSDLHLTQSFTLDFEALEALDEALTQVRLYAVNTEARALNPRKVSVSLEICGELCAYRREEHRIGSTLPQAEIPPICTRTESGECELINAVCEKTFVISEQLSFAAGKPVPSRLVWQSADFHLSDRQLVGSKVLVKGVAYLAVCYLSEECAHPVSADFSLPFSQLIDIGQENMDECTVVIEPTTLYFSLLDQAVGGKALDVEIHAVAQLVSRFRQELTTLSDAFCPRMPSELRYESWFCRSVRPGGLTLSAEERLPLPEDADDVLAVFPTLTQSSIEAGKAAASVALDVLYRNTDGALASLRRMIELAHECPCGGPTLCESRLTESAFRPEGRTLAVRLSVELLYENRSEREIRNAVSITLDEEARYDPAAFPTVTAVRVDQESLWELAKRYHSSCERIEALNEIDGPIQGKMLLIPKQL